jgi:hypothetical protein
VPRVASSPSVLFEFDEDIDERRWTQFFDRRPLRPSLKDLASKARMYHGRWRYAGTRISGSETGADTSIVEDVLSSLLEEGIRVPVVADVRATLERTEGLADLALAAGRAARNRLASIGQLSLEVWQDPETSERNLVLFARTADYSYEFNQRLEQVWDDLFIDLLLTNAWITVTTDFRPPPLR